MRGGSEKPGPFRLQFVIDELEDVGRDALKSKTDRLQAQIRALDERIKKASVRSGKWKGDVAELVERITDRLAEFATNLGSLPAPATRRLVASFVSRAVVDLETRDVELELCLPEWALGGENARCLDGTFSRKSDIEAHHATGLRFLAPSLIWDGKQRAYGAIDFGIAA